MSAYRLKGASGPVMNKSFPLGDHTVIGRAADCGIRLDGDDVAERHAEIAAIEGGLTLRRLTQNFEVLLNGKPVETARLASGDEIRIATHRFVLQAPGLRPDKVLTAEATRPRRTWPLWVLVGGLLTAAALAWYLGLLPF